MRVTIHGLEDDDQHELDHKWGEILASSPPFTGQGTLEIWCIREAGHYRITEAELHPVGSPGGGGLEDVAPAVCRILKDAGQPVICMP